VSESEQPERGDRDRLIRWVGVGISVVSLAGVIIWASRQDAPTFPQSPAEIAALLGAVAIVAVAMALRGERTQRLLIRAEAEPDRRDSYALTAVNFMGNAVLPARGGDAIRAYLQAPRARTSVRNVVGVMVAERVLDAAFLITLFVTLAYVVLRGIDAPGGARVGIALAAVAAAAVVAFIVLRLSRDHPRVRAALDWLAPMAAATRRLRGRHGAAMAAMTAAIWICEALAYFTVGIASEVDLSIVESLYLVGLASVFVLIPSGPGYIGTFDAAIVLGVRAIGGEGGEALSYAILLRFVLLVPVTAVGLLLVITRYGGFGLLRGTSALRGERSQ